MKGLSDYLELIIYHRSVVMFFLLYTYIIMYKVIQIKPF